MRIKEFKDERDTEEKQSDTSSVSELDDAPLNHSTQNNDDEMKNNNINRISYKNSNHTYRCWDY